MTLQLSFHEMEHQMKLATVNRQSAKLAFRQVQAYSNSTSAFSGVSHEDWKDYEQRQKELLEAELQVIKLAVSGVSITDYAERCKSSEKDLQRGDISFEIQLLFSYTVSNAVRELRQRMNKVNIGGEKQSDILKVITRILEAPLNVFYEIADTLAEALLDCIEKQIVDARIRLALARALMCISDCFRYTYKHPQSKNAAQFMQIISPRDPEAHMRLGMTLAMIVEKEGIMQPLFHYCVFLANRKVPLNHREAVVVQRFVRDFPTWKRQKELRGLERRSTLFQRLVEVLWSILSDESDVAEKKVYDDELWTLLAKCMEDGLTEGDMSHTVGVIIFAHFRCSTMASPDKTQFPARELADYFVAKFLLATTQHIAKVTKEMCSALRNRRKKRRRALQKKRRHDGTCANPDPNIVLGYEVFKTMIPFQSTIPMFASLSFLAFYWSKARSAPSPSVDLKPLGLLLKTLQEVLDSFRKIEEATNVLQITSHVDSKLLAGTEALLPAMVEDLKFSNFAPCLEDNMFRQASIPAAPLPSFMKRHSDGIVRHALGLAEMQSYEAVVSSTSQRHLEAFSQQCVNEVGADMELLGREMACELVCLTVRKFRLRRLVVDLEKVAGGKLARMSFQSSSENGLEGKHHRDPFTEILPLPGQAISPCQHGNSLGEHSLAENLHVKVDKARRVIGNLTAVDALTSSAGSAQANKQKEHADARKMSRRALLAAVLESPETPHEPIPRQKPQELPKTPISASRRRLLSQGSFQLNYALQDRHGNEKNAAGQGLSRRSEISRILGNVLYARDAETRCSPGDSCKPVPWRRPPKDDLAETIFHSQTSSG